MSDNAIRNFATENNLNQNNELFHHNMITNLMENDIPKSKLRQMRDIMQRRGLNTTVLADDGGANIPTATVVIGTANPMH